MLKHIGAPLLLASFLFSIPLSAVTYPALPTATVDVTCCPATTRTVAVHTAAQLQAAFDDATLGDDIILDAGSTYKGNFILKIPTGSTGWVTVRSSASGSLPSRNTRVGTSDASNMAKIMSPNYGDPGNPAFPAIGNRYESTTYTDMGIHHYWFLGIEFAIGLTNANYHVIDIAPPPLGVPFSTYPGSDPHDIIIDRCLIHGNPLTTTFPAGSAYLNGSALFDVANGAIVDSKIYNLWAVGTETQSIGSYGGPGPLLLQNNEISGGTESFIAGGGTLPYSDINLSDVTVVHNYFNKPLAWFTSTPDPFVKNLFELKVGRRVRLTDNVFDHNWDREGGGAQYGYSVVLTTRPYQDSGWGQATDILQNNEVSDVLVANNVSRNSAGFISSAEYDSYCTTGLGNHPPVSCAQSKRALIVNNMADYDSHWFPGHNSSGIAVGAMQDLSIKRNTLLGHNIDAAADSPAFSGSRDTCDQTFGTNFEFTYNLILNGVTGACAYDPANILVASWLGAVSVTSTLIANLTAGGQTTAWNAFGHSTQVAATEANLKLNVDELTLQASSPYFGMGIGANLSCFNEAAVRAGTPSALCPLPPEVQAGATPQVQASCDLNNDGKVNVLDVQLATNQALGSAACGTADLNGDGSCTIVDVMRIISASLGAACNTGP